jgi:hypothetical protein
MPFICTKPQNTPLFTEGKKQMALPVFTECVDFPSSACGRRPIISVGHLTMRMEMGNAARSGAVNLCQKVVMGDI